MKKVKVTQAMKDQIVALRKQGLTYAVIAKEVGVSEATAGMYGKGVLKKVSKKKVAKKISATHRTTKTTKVVYDDTPTKPALDEGSDPSNIIALAAMTILGAAVGYFFGVGM